MTFLPAFWWALVTALGAERPALFGQEFEAAAWGVAGVVSVWLRVVISGVIFGLAFTVLLQAMTRLLRKEWLAAILFCVVMTFGACVRDGGVTDPYHIVALALPFVVLAVIMLRFGLLATVVLMGLAHLGILYPVTGFSGPWWAGGRMTLLSAIVVVAAYGAWCCARRPPSADAARSDPLVPLPY